MLEQWAHRERANHFWVYYNAQGDRWCGRENHWVSPDQFHKNVQWCKTCRTAYFKEKYDPKEARKRNFKYYYGHQEDIYRQLFEAQGGVCAICKQPPQKRKLGRARTEVDHLSLDHDHATGRPRGLLCQSCNMVLGWMHDNPDAVDNVRSYLEMHRENPG